MPSIPNGQHEWLKEISKHGFRDMYQTVWTPTMNLFDTTIGTPTGRIPRKNSLDFSVGQTISATSPTIESKTMASIDSIKILHDPLDYIDIEERILSHYITDSLNKNLTEIYLNSIDPSIVPLEHANTIIQPDPVACLEEVIHQEKNSAKNLYENKTVEELLEILAEKDFEIEDLEAEIADIENEKILMQNRNIDLERQCRDPDNALTVLANKVRIDEKRLYNIIEQEIKSIHSMDRNYYRSDFDFRRNHSNKIFF